MRDWLYEILPVPLLSSSQNWTGQTLVSFRCCRENEIIAWMIVKFLYILTVCDSRTEHPFPLMNRLLCRLNEVLYVNDVKCSTQVLPVMTASSLFTWQPHGLQPARPSVHGISQAGILEWVAMPSSRGSFPPRDWTWVPCIADSFFYHHWSTREALLKHTKYQ